MTIRSNLFAVLGVLYVLQLTGTRAVGQTQSPPDSLLQAILSQSKSAPLSQNDAVEHALQKATSVRTAEAAYFAARGAARREGGLFDPEFFFSFNYLDRDEPTASFFSGAPVLSTVQTTSRTGLRWESPIGTNLEASLNTLRLQTNSSFASLNPQYTAFGNLSIRQPLLGGFHVSARKEVTKADQEMEAAKARYDQEVLAIRTTVEKSYWDLYAAERDFAVQQLTRDRAEAFLKETELRAATGLIGPNQVASARTFLAEQEILLLDREEQWDRLSDQIASLMGTRPEGDTRRFLTTDDPPEEFPLEDVDALVRQAMENNLDLHAAEADIEARRALSSAAFWEALPRVDLVGSVGGNGLSGTGQPVSFGDSTFPAPPSRSFGDAIRDAINRDNPTWSVGVEVSIPIGLRTGLGEQDRLEAEVTIAEQRHIQAKRLLEEQVRTSYQELEHGKLRLKAAREGVEAAQEQVRIGTIEFQNGRTTAFELVRLGADFAIAQQRYSQALVRGAKAAASLRQLTSGAYSGAQAR